jgi:cytochrome P450
MTTGTVGFEPRSGETWRDPFPMYAALRDVDPVHHVADGDYWVLSRYADVAAAALDTETFSSAQGLTFTYGELAAAGLEDIAPMVFLDPPEHSEFRRLVVRGFTPRQVTAVEPDIRRFCVERIEQLREAGGGDIVAELFKPLPSFVVGRYLGVPDQDRNRFDGWTQGIVAANALGDPLLAATTVAELFGYFTELIEWRRADPADDTISDLVQAADAEQVSALRILGFAFTMVTGGNDTTTGLLGGAAELLDPELVTPMVVFLCSEACTFTHEAFSAAAGRYGRVFVGLAPGWYAGKDAKPTAEDILDHLEEIEKQDGYIVPTQSGDELGQLFNLLQG